MRKLIHLNVDIVFGAVINASVIAMYFEKEIRIYELALLGVVVWIIYTLDRIFDVNKDSFKEFSLRHQFHKNNQKPLIIAVGIALIFGGFLIPFLNQKTLIMGISVSFIVVLYFIFVKSHLKGSKELLIALIYTLGIFLPTISIGLNFLIESVVIFSIYFILALTNLIIISILEFEKDAINRDRNLVQTLGVEKSLKILFGLILIGVCLSFYTYYFSQSIIALLFLVMFIVYLLTITNRTKIMVNEYYRLYIDSVLIIPGLLLLT